MLRYTTYRRSALWEGSRVAARLREFDSSQHWRRFPYHSRLRENHPVVLQTSKRFILPLPNSAQMHFSPYPEIDLPSETRIQSIRASGLGRMEWVALEKVHGTNFGIYLIDEKEVRFAKRSGIMDPNENFFGYHIYAKEFEEQIRSATEILKQKFDLTHIGRVVLNGEFFGGKYDHPLVPKSQKWCTMPDGKTFPIRGVQIQREPFPQYSPELHFYAFDLKYSISGLETDFRVLDYDQFDEICSQIPKVLYAKPLVRGTLDQCLAFDVENFTTPLPALLGLGNYPLEGNLAEGVVIRLVKRGDPKIEQRYNNVSTIIKLRCSCFMELKHPGKQKELKETFIDTVRAAALKSVGGGVTIIPKSILPQLESAAYALLINNVSEGRLNNVLSKVGREPLLNGSITKDDVVLMLAKDSLKDFLKEIEPAVLNTSLSFRKLLTRGVYEECVKFMAKQWTKVISEEKKAAAEA